MDHHLRDSVEYHGRPWNDQFKFQDASLYQIATRFVYDVMDKIYTVSGRRQTYIRAFLFALSILNPSTAKSLYIYLNLSKQTSNLPKQTSETFQNKLPSKMSDQGRKDFITSM